LITPQQIDDQQLAERYLAGQLGEHESAEFERHVAEHPQVLDDLQAAAGIKIGLAMLRGSGELKQLTTPRVPRWRLGLAMAATILVASVGTNYVLRERPWQQPAVATAGKLFLGRTAALKVIATYDVQRTRSDMDVTITKPAAAGALELRLIDAFRQTGRYRAELFSITDDARTLQASTDAVSLDAQGFPVVLLEAASLQIGSYELRLTGYTENDSQIYLNDFLIGVVPEGTP
jgi:hypothetical protein